MRNSLVEAQGAFDAMLDGVGEKILYDQLKTRVRPFGVAEAGSIMRKVLDDEMNFDPQHKFALNFMKEADKPPCDVCMVDTLGQRPAQPKAKSLQQRKRDI